LGMRPRRVLRGHLGRTDFTIGRKPGLAARTAASACARATGRQKPGNLGLLEYKKHQVLVEKHRRNSIRILGFASNRTDGTPSDAGSSPALTEVSARTGGDSASNTR
jgi:hypothetical protein